MELYTELASLKLTEMQRKLTPFTLTNHSDNTSEPAGDGSLRRSSRLKSRPDENCNEKRRVFMKPKKYSEDEIIGSQNFFSSKKIKRLNPALETIFEEPKQLKDDVQYVSSRRYKRSIFFEPDHSRDKKLKTKKRLLKAKKFNIGKYFNKRKKLTLELLKRKLDLIESLESDNQQKP